MRSGHVSPGESFFHLFGRSSWEDLGDWTSGDDEVTRTIIESDDRIHEFGDLGELGVPDELEVATLGGDNHSTSREMCIRDRVGVAAARDA